VQAVLHDLMNLIQPIVGLTELLALRPAVASDPVAAGHVRNLLAAGEATIARVGELRRLTATAGHPGGAAPAVPPGAAIRGGRD
jgi:hypothetical protein